MKRTILSLLLILAGATLLPAAALPLTAAEATQNAAQEEHGFGVREYKEFHDVLRVLQHEALPAKDFKTIRTRAEELVTRGEAIVNLGVPGGVDGKNVPQFTEGLKKFGAALLKFNSDAGSGTDDQLKESYLAVHDRFETLADMLPKK